ncbi:hypothetical protein HAX54_037445 [Datura stramonium]|uniref:TF-B3 domain-containing protein n=1 Tax=Datura stramonium TaxID=4076 RepID=A0ABS8VLH9_DATST|nr:hypothetical protein [Datura stramonium]
MTTVRLFGKNIEVKEKKSIKLFGKIITVTLQQEEPQQVAPLILQEEEEEEALIQRDLPPPNMSEAIRLAGGSGPVYIGRKKVEDSDVKQNLSRFFIPPGTCDERILKYLSSMEREKLENYKGRLEVTVMDPQGKFHDMNFTRWKSLTRCVFNKGWNKFVSANELQKGDIVDLWHFRIRSQLCFAINIIIRN